jgi:fructokinase
VETYLSGPGLSADHVRGTGEKRDAAEIARRAATGDARCDATLSRYEARLARALAVVVNIVDPDVIVLGGGMSNVPGLAEAATARLPRWVFSDAVATRIVCNVHGDSSGVRGAAWLWPLADGTPRHPGD